MPESKQIFAVKKWNGSKPEDCQLCDRPLKKSFVDGRVRGSNWHILCEVCHIKFGVGLGVGRGQKYDLKTLEKVEG
jgi:hypothetical protein